MPDILLDILVIATALLSAYLIMAAFTLMVAKVFFTWDEPQGLRDSPLRSDKTDGTLRKRRIRTTSPRGSTTSVRTREVSRV
jgi:hypothetical protein